MHRFIILAISASCLAFIDCDSGKVMLGTEDTSQANFWCGFYTSTIVYGHASDLCRDEINALGESGSDAWYEQSVRLVLTACTDYVLSAEVPEDVEDVVKYACRDGYDEDNVASAAIFDSLTCEDITSEDFVLTWPYEELCPCIADGLTVPSENGALTCSPNSATTL